MEKEKVLNQEGLDQYDELIKNYLKQQIESVGDIVDIVPNEIIKMLWDGEIKFEELVPVSGDKNHIPVDKKTNLLHFLNIFGINGDYCVRFSGGNLGSKIHLKRLSSSHCLFWSKDKIVWNAFNEGDYIQLNSDDFSDSVYVVGVLFADQSDQDYTQFGTEGLIGCEGPINALWNFTKNTALKNYCGYSLFADCETLLNIGIILPSNTLSEYCYEQMFNGCTSLTTAPELHATTLASHCYDGMFYGCTSLTTAPELPATTLASYCYQSMFWGCTSLTTAPELPATTLVDGCYSHMFYGCSNLNYIKCDAIDISADDCTLNWLSDVAEEGTFEMDPTVLWSRGGSGIPEGWNIVFDEEKAPYIMVKSNDTTGDVELHCNMLGSNQEVEYSTDRVLWNQLSSNDTIKIYKDSPLYLRGILTGPNCLDDGDYTNLRIHVVSGDYTHTAELYGNVNSIWDYRDLNAPLKEECGICLFSDSKAITKAPALPSRTLSGGCYAYMFQYCKSLTASPELPATVLPGPSIMDYGCYENMFSDCTSLTTAPELPATTLGGWCYTGMFQGCSSLTTAPALHATTLASSCYMDMFQYCTSLTTAPELPATTLANNCYKNMFSDCTSLTKAPELPATTLANWCYTSMFQGCTNLNYIKCLATDISATACINDWLIGVAGTGTFVKDISATWPTGKNGIPSGWTVINNKKKK